jgi:hypothetical protein
MDLEIKAIHPPSHKSRFRKEKELIFIEPLTVSLGHDEWVRKHKGTNANTLVAISFIEN